MAGEEQSWTVGRLLSWTADYFKSKGLDEPMLSAQLLLAKVLSCSKVDLYLRFEQPVEQGRRDEFRALVKRAADREPIAYLIGQKEFFSLSFIVNRSVLIPRPETELLVQWVVRKVRDGYGRAEDRLDILDLGTGSGCIAVALAKFLPRPARITAVEQLSEAGAVARENIARHGVGESVTVSEGDLYGPVGPGAWFDFLVSNPPYVTEEDYAALPKHIMDYEPASALVAGPDGLAVIRKIVAGSGQYLKSGGYLAMEIGYNQSDAVAKLLTEAGLAEVAFERDGAGIARIALGRKA